MQNQLDILLLKELIKMKEYIENDIELSEKGILLYGVSILKWKKFINESNRFKYHNGTKWYVCRHQKSLSTNHIIMYLQEFYGSDNIYKGLSSFC